MRKVLVTYGDDSDRLPRAWRLVLAGVVLAAAAVMLRGYVTDDTFIHLRYAQHLAERGEFSFNPGDSTYGATSPLWIFGLQALLSLGLEPFRAAWVLGLLGGVLTLLVMDRLLTLLPLSAKWRGTLLLLCAADAWFLRWTFSGMETPLATALLLVLLLPFARRGARPLRAPALLAWGAAAGLAGLTRPELTLLAAVAVPWLLGLEQFRFSGGAWRRPGLPAAAAMIAGGWLLVTGPWLLFAWRVFGRLTPETATAKSNSLTLAPAALAETGLRCLQQLGAIQAPLWIGLGLMLVLALIGRGSSARLCGLGERYHNWPPGSRVALVGTVLSWCVVLVGGYAVKQVWVISRYVAPLLPPLLVAGAALAGGRRLRQTRLAVPILAVATVATLLLNGWLLTAKVGPHARDFSRGVRECYWELGEWLRMNTDAGATVAALDIGAVGYASDRRVLDLMGLVSPRIMELGRKIGFQEMVTGGDWLEVETPDYFIDRSEGEPRWAGRTVRGVRFELLDTCVISGVGISEPQPWTVALYRLEADSPR